MGLFTTLFGKTGSSDLSQVIKEGAFLVDVRTASEYLGGSVKGAVNIPLDDIERQLAKFRGKEHIVVFCLSGGRSSQAKSILEKSGFRNVINGGTWQNVRRLVMDDK